MGLVVAAHQPNFLPWLGFWDKLARADVLVLLDDVQFPQTGAGTWLNRVRMIVSGSPRWVTVPVRRTGRGLQLVRDVEVDDGQPWREKLLRTLRTSYGGSCGFDETFPLVHDTITYAAARLAELNLHGIDLLGTALGLDTGRLVLSSGVEKEGAGTDLLISLTHALGGTTYLSGDGADEYQDVERYAERGLELRFQEFDHPTYPQPLSAPVRGLSVVDAMMNVGIDGAGRLISSAATRA